MDCRAGTLWQPEENEESIITMRWNRNRRITTPKIELWQKL